VINILKLIKTTAIFLLSILMFSGAVSAMYVFDPNTLIKFSPEHPAYVTEEDLNNLFIDDSYHELVLNDLTAFPNSEKYLNINEDKPIQIYELVENKTAPKDKSPPKIISKPKSTKFPRNNNINIKFNELIKKGPNWTKITIKDSKGHIIKGAVQIKTQTVSINPNKKLKKYAAYTVNLPAGSVQDKNGNKNLKCSFKFKTCA